MWAMWVIGVGQAAEPQYKRLYSQEAQATSFLSSTWNRYDENYHPNYALDGNPATAWVEGVDGDGVGQVLSWDVSALSSARSVKLRIRNGYQKSDALLAANGAPRDVVVTVWRGREVVAEKAVELKRENGWQDVVIDTGGKGFNHLELKIGSVTPGSKYKDTCVSDIETWVDSDVAYNEAFERSKHDRLVKWAAERLETAKLFAALPKTWPFAAPSFRAQSTEAIDQAAFDAAAAPLREVATRLSKGTLWYSAAFQPSAPTRVPDGLEELEPLVRALRADDVAFFEASAADRKRSRQTEEGDGWSLEQWTENYRLEKEGAAPRWASTRSGSVEEGRVTTTTETQVVLGWDPQGHVTSARWLDQHDDGEGFHQSREVVLRLRWSADGKVDQVEIFDREESSGWGEEQVGRTHSVWAP